MLPVKDYYAALEIPPSASIADIKKAYRKLALQFHPDKNPGDPYAGSRFAEIKEAYEVLTDPSKKEYYLQQRWYAQSTGQRQQQTLITPETVLKQALELERQVAKLDLYRMDKEGLKDYFLEMLSPETIRKLQEFQEPATLRTILETLLKAVHPLPKVYSGIVLERLLLLAGPDPIAVAEVKAYAGKKERQHRREKYSLILILAATVLLCLLIWLGSR